MPGYDNRSLSLLAAMAAENRLPHASAGLLWIAARVALWVRNVQSRKALSYLSDHHLSDIGLSRSEAERESLKRFWMP